MKKSVKIALVAGACVVVAGAATTGVVLAVNNGSSTTEPTNASIVETSAVVLSELPVDEIPENIETDAFGTEQETVSHETVTVVNDIEEEPQQEQHTDDYSSNTIENAWLNEYVPTSAAPSEIGAELKAEILSASAKEYNDKYLGKLQDAQPLSADDCTILSFYGMYNGCAVGFLRHNTPEAFVLNYSENIGGVTFNSDGIQGNRKMCVYRNGEFYELGDAYNNGWLSDTDLKDICYYKNILLDK